QAEHVMIVDLMRNDLGRVCDYGSVRWELTPRLEAHAGVWHLVSQVGGDLHEDWGDGRLLRATFPPGSVTGAPKVQAMRVIAAVEGTAREVYTGALGLSSPASGLELAVAIRTLEVDGTRAWVGVGGGIVADSRPQAELAEALSKAAALVGAAGGTVDAGSVPAKFQRLIGVPWLPSASVRPDPSGGLVDTVYVADGHPRHVERHVARLDRSLRELGHAPLESGTADRIRAFAAEHAATGHDGRVRVLAVPDEADRGGRPLAPQLQFVVQEPQTGAVLLAPMVVPGGLGTHKWLDRRFVDQARTELGATPLLLDADGTVLEAGWANVWWLHDGVLHTPPLDGRQLPGVMRGLLLERRGQAPLPIVESTRTYGADLADLPLLLTSARGVTPARLADTPPAVTDEAARLAAALQPLTAERR
ncbi:MAG: chorismate-binding protein, partial [Solirubrobacteraceae bacterium]|nr:chorismate-binding protein [Solirubrobacteraceae bacterium]